MDNNLRFYNPKEGWTFWGLLISVFSEYWSIGVLE